MMTIAKQRSKHVDRPEDLVTPFAHALALSTPRSPPLNSAQRALLLGRDPARYPIVGGSGLNPKDEQLVRKLLHQAYHQGAPSHPYLSYKQHRDAITRWLSTYLLSTKFLNRVRDEGYFRAIVNALVKLGIPVMAVGSPRSTLRFIKLCTRVQQLRYGRHAYQTIDLFDCPKSRQLLVFVHGGAWGSGRSWKYRLVAKPWLDLGYNVAVVGYRTYPDARIHGQVVDLQEAMHFLLNKHYHDAHNDMTVHLVGHSSGAHVALTHMVQHAKQLLMAMSHQHSWSSGFRRPYDSFIGISGPYNVSNHFDYEAARGVEELSPLKAVNGLSREALIQNSPGTQLQQLLLEYDGMLQQHFPPRILLAHGVEDTTVPFTATAELAHVLRDCGITGVDQLYLARTGHQDAVLQLMLGGLTLDRIITWVETVAKAQTKAEVFGRQQVVIQSRL